MIAANFWFRYSLRSDFCDLTMLFTVTRRHRNDPGSGATSAIRYAVARSVRPNFAFCRPERSFVTFVISVTNSPFPDFHHREESFSNGATGLIQDHNGVMQGTARLARIRYAVARLVRPNVAFYRPERSFVTFAISVTNSPIHHFQIFITEKSPLATARLA